LVGFQRESTYVVFFHQFRFSVSGNNTYNFSCKKRSDSELVKIEWTQVDLLEEKQWQTHEKLKTTDQRSKCKVTERSVNASWVTHWDYLGLNKFAGSNTIRRAEQNFKVITFCWKIFTEKITLHNSCWFLVNIHEKYKLVFFTVWCTITFVHTEHCFGELT
jgi:hypothetical protein